MVEEEGEREDEGLIEGGFEDEGDCELESLLFDGDRGGEIKEEDEGEVESIAEKEVGEELTLRKPRGERGLIEGEERTSESKEGEELNEFDDSFEEEEEEDEREGEEGVEMKVS